MSKASLAIPVCLALTAAAYVGVTKVESRAARADVPVASAPQRPVATATPPTVHKVARVVDLDDADAFEKPRPKKTGRRPGRAKVVSGY